MEAGVYVVITGMLAAIATLFRMNIRMQQEHMNCRIEIAELKSQLKDAQRPEDHNEAIVIMDHRGIILEWNAAATLLFEWTASEIVGKPATTLIPRRYLKAHMEAFAAMIKGGRPPKRGPVDGYGKKKYGDETPVRILLAGWGTNGTSVIGAYISHRTPGDSDKSDWDKPGATMEGPIGWIDEQKDGVT